MNGMKIKKDDEKTLKMINEVFSKLDKNLPPGCKINEGSIEVDDQIYSVDGEDLYYEKQNIKKINDEFTKMDNSLPPGWELKGASVKENNEVYNIKRIDENKRSRENRRRSFSRSRFTEENLGGGRKRQLEMKHEYSRRLDDQDGSERGRQERGRRLEERHGHSSRLDHENRLERGGQERWRRLEGKRIHSRRLDNENRSEKSREEKRRPKSRSRDNFRQDEQRDREGFMMDGNIQSGLPPDWKIGSYENSDARTESEQINEINYSRIKENNERTNYDDENSSKEEMMMKIVYSEGDLDADPYNAVVDTGCPKTVCGKAFMDSFITSKGKDVFIRRKYEKENFKFGNGQVYTSTESHEIDVEIGRMKTKIWTSVIDANIPLLLGLDYLKKWGVVIDIENESLFIRKCDQSFKINSRLSNHWKLQIQSGKVLHKRAHQLVLKVDLCNLDDIDLRKHILKTHKNLSHKSDGQLLKLFQMAGKADTRVRKKIKEVVESCDVCKKFKKTRPRPSVALAKANTSNEVVSLDLKEKRQYNRHILYCVDEFNGYPSSSHQIQESRDNPQNIV